jgi:hypothetical protein
VVLTEVSSVGIEVMDYLPTTLYISPPATNFYWGKVDDALRSAAYRCFASLICPVLTS